MIKVKRIGDKAKPCEDELESFLNSISEERIISILHASYFHPLAKHEISSYTVIYRE